MAVFHKFGIVVELIILFRFVVDDAVGVNSDDDRYNDSEVENE